MRFKMDQGELLSKPTSFLCFPLDIASVKLHSLSRNRMPDPFLMWVQLDNQNIKLRCLQSHTSSKGREGRIPACPFQLWSFQVFLGLWPPHCNLCIYLHMAFSSLCLFLFCVLKIHLSLDGGPTHIVQNALIQILHLITPAEVLFQVRSQ